MQASGIFTSHFRTFGCDVFLKTLSTVLIMDKNGIIKTHRALKIKVPGGAEEQIIEYILCLGKGADIIINF